MFRIGGKAYEGTMLVCGEVLPWGGYADVDSLVELRELIDIIVIGTGPEMTHLPKAFRRHWRPPRSGASRWHDAQRGPIMFGLGRATCRGGNATV